MRRLQAISKTPLKLYHDATNDVSWSTEEYQLMLEALLRKINICLGKYAAFNILKPISKKLFDAARQFRFSLKYFPSCSRIKSVFRTLQNIYDGIFHGNSNQLKTVDSIRKKAPSQLFHRVVNASLDSSLRILHILEMGKYETNSKIPGSLK